MVHAQTYEEFLKLRLPVSFRFLFCVFSIGLCVSYFLLPILSLLLFVIGFLSCVLAD